MESIQTLNYYLCMFKFYGKIVLVTVYIGSAVNCQFSCFFTIAQASGLPGNYLNHLANVGF